MPPRIFTDYEAKVRKKIYNKWHKKTHPEMVAERVRRFKEKHPHYARDYNKRDPERTIRHRRATLARLREKLFSIYGSFCVCCNEIDKRFLTLDHIQGDGSQERKSNRSSDSIYRSAIKNIDKQRYQILCHNCNFAKHVYKICPHQQTETIIDQYINSQKNKDG